MLELEYPHHLYLTPEYEERRFQAFRLLHVSSPPACDVNYRVSC